MRILLLNWRDIKHPLAGGAEISTHEHAKAWIKAGHSVMQFSSFFPGALEEETVDGIYIVRQGNHYTVHLRAFFYYQRFLKHTIDFAVDEFHAIPFFTSIYTRVPKLAFIHETAEEIWFKNKIFPVSLIGYIIERISFTFYRHVPFMTVSESTKNDLTRFGIRPSNITIIHNGTTTIHNTFTKEKFPTIICLGRLSKDKRTEDAVLAFSFVKTAYPDAVLWIAGKEESHGYQKKIERLAQKLSVSDSIVFFGHVSEGKKYELMKRAWVLVHPSIKEGWGLTVIEAASQSTPAVGYDTSGLRDSIIDSKTGFLAREDTPQALAEKICILFDNKVRYNTICKNALRWSKKFSWERSTAESLALIESMYEHRV